VLPLHPIVIEDRVALLLRTLGQDPTSLTSAVAKAALIFDVGVQFSAAGWNDILFLKFSRYLYDVFIDSVIECKSVGALSARGGYRH
jgi:hypothetical protein